MNLDKVYLRAGLYLLVAVIVSVVLGTFFPSTGTNNPVITGISIGIGMALTVILLDRFRNRQ